MKLAVYPGSFDPVTLGHLDIIVRASKIFDKLIVGVPINPDKHASFSVEERMELLRRATQAEGLANVEIDKVDGLLADYAKRRGAMVVVKGLRALSDFEYEFQRGPYQQKAEPRAGDHVPGHQRGEHVLKLQHGQAGGGLWRGHLPLCAGLHPGDHPGAAVQPLRLVFPGGQNPACEG